YGRGKNWAIEDRNGDRRGGHGAGLVVRGDEVAEDDEVARGLFGRASPGLAHQLVEAEGARHPARQGRVQDPGGTRVQVDLVPEAQGVARDALVPGLARDHFPARLEGDAARELQARVSA